MHRGRAAKGPTRRGTASQPVAKVPDSYQLPFLVGRFYNGSRPSRLLFAGKLGQKLGPGHPPVAFSRVQRNSKDLGRFLNAQSAKVAQFHHSPFPGIDSSECLECRIRREHFNPAGLRRHEHLVERQALGISSRFGETATARMVDKDAPDHPRATVGSIPFPLEMAVSTRTQSGASTIRTST